MITATNLDVLSGEKRLLNNVSLRVNPGELLMVLGPNGAGKSTLLRTLSGEIKPDRGKVELNERNVLQWPLHQLAQHRAVMTQSPQIPFALKVSDVVEMGLQCWSMSRNAIKHCTDAQLHRVGMHAYAQRNYLTLSGGEQQRVQLARMLAQLVADGKALNNRYLLLDEPLAALDLNHQQRVLRLLRELVAQGLGVLCVIHDINLAALYADKLLVLKSGEICFYDQPKALIQRKVIEHTYGADLLCHPHQDDDGTPQWQFRR